MEQLQRIGQNVCDDVLSGLIAGRQSGLEQLDVPVAEDVPDEVIQLAQGR
jgi:hypothetical protein